MSELEESLNNTVSDEGASQSQETVENTAPAESLHDILSAPDEPETPQELWKQSNQFKQGLWKSPDDVYNSVKYYEQKFQPLEQSLKRMGFKEPADLEQAYKDYQEKLPTYQENEQTINLLNALLQNENYGSKLRGVLDEIRKAQEL